jgi:exodeoxyribonuclease-1
LHTFLWHDYETFGVEPRRDRPAQFAALRTDADLNELGEPLMIYCRPANDYLPNPEACLITGITPQDCLQKGLPEFEFAARIEAVFSVPGTVGVGYNTIRFDDEVTRFLFWRNLIDPYAREWQNDCGRWDLMDVVRLAYALRPEGIQWPTKADGSPSFKLEHLTRANGLQHDAAHDALSDVRATIALARLIKQHQPRLFDFAFSLHKKDRVAQELGLPTALSEAKPFLHISGTTPASRGCLSLLQPLATHPSNKNEVICWDLAHDPAELATLDIETAKQRLFTRRSELPEGMTRLNLVTVALNKSPMVVGNLKTLRPEMAERWGLNVAQGQSFAASAQLLPDLSHLWRALYARDPVSSADTRELDVDETLYAGFLDPADRRRLHHLRSLTPEELALDRSGFDDPRLPEMVFRYRARNFPDTLLPEEAERWEAHRAARLFEGEGGARQLDDFFAQIDHLTEQFGEEGNERGEAILGALYDYAEMIAPEF